MFHTTTASPSPPTVPQVASAAANVLGGPTTLTLDSIHQQQPQSVTGVIHNLSNQQHQPCSPVSTTSAFLLGIHNCKALEKINLPEYVREHQTVLTFPEKLMLMLTYVDKEYPGKEKERCCVSWAPGGRAFVIRSKEDICKEFLPLFFRQTKFSSFTRKLYRWGFRQVSLHHLDRHNKRELTFGHELFQRDDKSLTAGMRSVTAASTRRATNSDASKKHQVQSLEKLAIKPKTESPSGNLVQRPVAKYLPGSMENHSLQPELTLSQLKPATILSATINTLNGQRTSSGDSTVNMAHTTLTVVKQACPITTSTSPAMNQLGQSLQVQQHAAELPNKTGESGDPNAYMRAAVDMLLRYASYEDLSSS